VETIKVKEVTRFVIKKLHPMMPHDPGLIRPTYTIFCYMYSVLERNVKIMQTFSFYEVYLLNEITGIWQG